MKLKYFICNDVSKSENLDTAFQNVSQQVLARVSPELRQHPSAAPSPILQSLIQLQYQSKEAENTKTNIHTISPGNVIPSVSAVQDIDPQQGDDLSGPRPSLLERQLLKRGLAPKDPLLRRFAALKSKRSASSSSKNSNLSALSEAAPVSHSFLNSVPSGRGMAKHWTRRRLSEMTPSSWTIFREQLGIDITPVNVRHPSEREGSSSQGSAASATRAVYTVDTVNPIRCWDEVRLPFALGCCVASFYDLPTAIQAQCIPLAMVELPSAIVSARQADSRGPPNPEVLNKIDIIGVAETGSGKTLSYLIPALVDICSRRPKLLGNHELIALGPMALIMVPTRELAEQVVREALTLLNPDVSKVRFAIKVANLGGKSSNPGNDSEGKSLIHEWEEHELSDLPNDASRVAYRREHNMLSEIRVVKVVGGEKAEEQFEKLSRGAHIVVGTIGQLAALLEDRFLSLANTQFVVVDEADRMIDERQQDTLIAVLERCPKPRQTLLFTATMSRACEEIARRYLSPKGFFVVRTLHRCASIRQNFELIPLIDNSKPEVHAKKKVSSRVSVLKNPKDLANEAVLRRLDPLIYPLKFNRLVTWLVHASGPIIIFAGEKRVCDALQDELRREAGHLAQILNERGLPPTGKGLMDVPSVDAPPRGLVFQEDTGLSLHAAQQRSIAAEETLASALLSSLKLENLTSTAVVHSELSQSERRRLTGLFHRQERKVLITTDLLSRGLDVPGVALVINYDLPWPSEKAPPGGTQRGSQETPDEAFVKYIHRIGRTGRAGATGIALSFVSLPLARVQKAASAIVARAAANGSGFHTQGPSGGRRGDELSRQIYPPGTTDAVKQRDRDRFELTHHHGDSYINTAFGSSEDDGVLNDVENDDDSDRESSRSSDGPRRPQKHFRGEEVTSTTLEGAESREYPSLYSDESLLGPLWKFLIQCIEGNGYSRSEAVRALLQQTYSKIDLPPALALIMHELSTQKGRYGTITQ